MPPTLFPSGSRTGATRSHTLIPPDPSGWAGIAVMEWELIGEEWTDEHPHDEYNYILEGRLLVTSDGVTVEAMPGSVVKVPGGSVGIYCAPEQARMLAIYGPNPKGEPTKVHGLQTASVPRDYRPA